MHSAARAIATVFLAAVSLQACRQSEPVAEWRYTKWGMSADEVRAASGGKAVPADSQDQSSDRARDTQVLLKAPVTWAGMEFQAYYGFDRKTQRLVSVTIQLVSPSARSETQLLGVLTRLYGQPYSGHEDRSTRILVWQSGNDQLSFIKLTDPAVAVGAPATSVNYQPISSGQ
jgi:hypothetical protein